MSSRHPSDRTAKGFALILGAARAAGLASRLSNGNALVQKAEHDELVILAMKDPLMAAAIHSARKTLPEIPRLGETSKPRDRRLRGHERFIGQINNTPRSIVNLKMGDTITFIKNEIVDWMYMDAGTTKGNYSAQAILKSAAAGTVKPSSDGLVWISTSDATRQRMKSGSA